MSKTRFSRLIFLLLLVAPSFLSAQTLEDPSLQAQLLTSGLSSPTTMAFIGPNDILVLQKNDGKVRRVIGGVLQSGHVLDVNVHSSSERGLLGIAVHPQFPSTPSVYLYYTESSTGGDTSGTATPLGNRVYRYIWNGTSLVKPTPTSPPILDLPATPGPNHDGGIITFGPDGKLYVVIGDLNRDGQLQNDSTGLPDDTSVILRLNDDGSTPADNPFAGQAGNLPKYYAYGIRNSFGLAFDPVTEKLWMTENGPSLYDEINQVEPGFNSGWNQIMGPDSRDPQGTGDLFVVQGSHYSDPEFSWLDTVGPTALVFLNSTALGINYENDLFVGDINGGNLYRFKLNSTRDGFSFNPGGGIDQDLVADNATELDEVLVGRGFGGITDLKVGPDGLLYVVSFSGSIHVISANATVTRTLSVASTNPSSGVSITVSPNDKNGAGNGITSFNRSYNNGTVVTLTAPSTVGASTFVKWRRNDVDHAFTQTTQITMNANYKMTAVYTTTTTTRTLSVASTNPSSGVSITVSPNDNNGAGNGTTPFNRSYNNGAVVTLTAPSTAGGNAFLKWQRDGVDHAFTSNSQVTMDANHTMTVVYSSEIIVDNAPPGQSGNGASFTGTWCNSDAANPFGANSLRSCGASQDTYRWTPTIPTSGTYGVYIWWTQSPSRSTSVPITVCHAVTCNTLNFNQQQNGGRWNFHGQYSFDIGTGGYVQVTDQNGQASADAVRFAPVP